MLLGGNEDTTLRELEELLGDQADERLRDARTRLQQAADVLTREVGMNRRLLREALSTTDQHVRTLVGAPATASTYASEGAAPPASGERTSGAAASPEAPAAAGSPGPTSWRVQWLAARRSAGRPAQKRSSAAAAIRRRYSSPRG